MRPSLKTYRHHQLRGGVLPRRSGMSYVEVLVAIVIAAIVSLGLYASAIYTMRETGRDLDHVSALLLANSAAAKVRAANYDKLTGDPNDLTTSEFEKQFFQTHQIESNPGAPSTTYTLTYKLKGFGKGISVASNWTKLTLTDGSAEIEANEFRGHMLVVTGGAGANQVMSITRNKASKTNRNGVRVVQVKLSKDLSVKTGNGNDTWSAPDSSSVFAVDYGIYCDVQVSWDGGEGSKTITEVVYVPNS